MARNIKLTAAAVERLPAPSKGQKDIFDSVLPGFAVRVSATGSKTFVLFYRIGGKLRRLTVGRYPILTLAEAREKARRALQQVELGNDPRHEKAERKRRQADTFGAVAESFIELYAKRRQRSWRVTDRILKRDIIPLWGDKPIESVSRRDVLDLLDVIMAEGKDHKANRVLGHLRKMFNWCIERDLVKVNPVSLVKAPGKEISRDRVLTDEEIAAVWAGCNPLGFPFGPFFRLLLITGQRRDEVAKMRWDDLSLGDRLWTLPREQTKSDRVHEVPISTLAMEVIERLPRTGTYVFSSGRRGDRPISGFSVAKKRLDRASGVVDWRLHDLRRTAASNMAKLNVPPHVVEKVLNHSSGTLSGVAGVYNRYGYLSEKRDALEMWAHRIGEVVEPRGRTNVVGLTC